MNKERLLTLVKFLKNLHLPINCNFDMNSWGKRKIQELDLSVDEVPEECGTRACAIGWACSIPEFKTAGFQLDLGNAPFFEGKRSYTAISHFFEIKEDTAVNLFASTVYDPTEKNNPIFVVNRILYVLKHGEDVYNKKVWDGNRNLLDKDFKEKI